MRLKYYALICLFLISCSDSGNPKIKSSNQKGKVVVVKDGDTIEILTSTNETITIRLTEIDCPEKRQAFGQKAKQFTSDFCFGKFVEIIGNKKDRYGRTLAFVFDEDGNNLNEALVRNGLAWQYVAHSKSEMLKKLEKEARDANLGLWIDENPIPPWEFRKSRKNNQIKIL
ncbi:MAG: nuclease [Pedobacter sp.]|nr:MAG: nuclease [Pedobacter sp.]